MSDKLSDYDATSSLFCVHDVNKTIVTINRDGTLTYGPDYNPDEAAKTFWNAMLNNNAVVALQLEADCLRAEVEKLRTTLKPFAELFLYPDDLGFEHAEDIRADVDWDEDSNDMAEEGVYILRRDIRRARGLIND